MTSVEVKTVLDDLAEQKNKILEKAAEELSKYLKEKAVGKGSDTSDIYSQLFKLTSEFTTEEKCKIFALALQKMTTVAGNQKKAASGGSFKGSKAASFSGSERRRDSRFGGWD